MSAAAFEVEFKRMLLAEHANGVVADRAGTRAEPNRLHRNPARAPRFHAERRRRRVGEPSRSAVSFHPHLLPPIFYLHADASGLRRLTS